VVHAYNHRYLSSKHKALSSNPSIVKKKKKRKEEGRKEGRKKGRQAEKVKTKTIVYLNNLSYQDRSTLKQVKFGE
jgi:ribosomal protein L9